MRQANMLRQNRAPRVIMTITSSDNIHRRPVADEVVVVVVAERLQALEVQQLLTSDKRENKMREEKLTPVVNTQTL
jgi:hypothetical protein